jgi:hypothetical protein
VRAVLRVVPLSFWLTMPTPASADEADPRPQKVTSALGVDVFATAFVGDGLRFNNPYRLATVLGPTAQSLSRTATYADAGWALTFGDAARAAHGIALRVSTALEGVPQAVLTPSYLLFHRSAAWAVYGRAGAAFVASPDVTWGIEAAGGTIWFARAGIGIAGELVGDVFYGAGTREKATPAYPVLSAQAGLWLAWEVLP